MIVRLFFFQSYSCTFNFSGYLKSFLFRASPSEIGNKSLHRSEQCCKSTPFLIWDWFPRLWTIIQMYLLTILWQSQEYDKYCSAQQMCSSLRVSIMRELCGPQLEWNRRYGGETEYCGRGHWISHWTIWPGIEAGRNKIRDCGRGQWDRHSNPEGTSPYRKLGITLRRDREV